MPRIVLRYWLRRSLAYVFRLPCPACGGKSQGLLCAGCLSQLTLLDIQGRCLRCVTELDEEGPCLICWRCLKDRRRVGWKSALFDQDTPGSMLLGFTSHAGLRAYAGLMVLQMQALQWPNPHVVIPLVEKRGDRLVFIAKVFARLFCARLIFPWHGHAQLNPSKLSLLDQALFMRHVYVISKTVAGADQWMQKLTPFQPAHLFALALRK